MALREETGSSDSEDELRRGDEQDKRRIGPSPDHPSKPAGVREGDHQLQNDALKRGNDEETTPSSDPLGSRLSPEEVNPRVRRSKSSTTAPKEDGDIRGRRAIRLSPGATETFTSSRGRTARRSIAASPHPAENTPPTRQQRHRHKGATVEIPEQPPSTAGAPARPELGPRADETPRTLGRDLRPGRRRRDLPPHQPSGRPPRHRESAPPHLSPGRPAPGPRGLRSGAAAAAGRRPRACADASRTSAAPSPHRARAEHPPTGHRAAPCDPTTAASTRAGEVSGRPPSPPPSAAGAPATAAGAGGSSG
nr:uncharacterized protein LOC127310374 [Lolium perenne]